MPPKPNLIKTKLKHIPSIPPNTLSGLRTILPLSRIAQLFLLGLNSDIFLFGQSLFGQSLFGQSLVGHSFHEQFTFSLFGFLTVPTTIKNIPVFQTYMAPIEVKICFNLVF